MIKIIQRSSYLIKLPDTVRHYNCSFKKGNRSYLLSLHKSDNVRYLCTTPEGPDIAAITNNDKSLEHKLKVLILEVDVMRQEGNLVPEDSFIKTEHWKDLLELPTISSRRRLLEFLFKISKKKENRSLKKQEKRDERLSNLTEKKTVETFDEFAQQYGLQNNNIFLRFYDTTINQFYNNRLIQAMRFGQKLVIDCGYYEQMSMRENKNCAKQIMLLFAENRMHNDPFDLYLCNTNPESSLARALKGFIATMYEPSFPLNVHECSYLDLFSKQNLVYLTPHCREEIEQYDHDAVYIIGGIVDKVNNEPLSLAKAKKEGLKMGKLPLDKYLQWGAGSGKSLTLNQVTSILLDAKHTEDWKYALRHVPKRKIVDYSDPEVIKQINRRTWTPSKNRNVQTSKSSDRLVKMRSIFEE